MSKSILVDKITEFRRLSTLCSMVEDTISKDKLKNSYGIIYSAQVISKVLFMSNALYNIEMVCEDANITGIRLRSDFSFTDQLEGSINSSYNFKKASRRVDEFTVMEDIVTILNFNISKMFLDNDNLLVPELETYLDALIPLLNNCIDTIKLLEFHKKGSIMRVLKENYRFANTIKSYYNREMR